MRIIHLIILLLSFGSVFSQTPFIREGQWKGEMYIYKYGQIVDSVETSLTVVNQIKDSVWQWKMEYHSIKTPVVKDYVLRIKDRVKGIYITDEGEGVVLTNYLIGNTMYCHFETEGILLTSTETFVNDDIIFEVSSGKKDKDPVQNIFQYSIPNLQRVVLKKIR